MIPSPQPKCLEDLNRIEVGAIRLIIPYVNMFKNKSGGRGSTGHCISFFQDISGFAQKLPESLPRPIKDLQMILVKESRNSAKKREYKVSGTKIRIALEWLIASNPDYKEIKINEENLAQYPSDTNDIKLPTYSDENQEERLDHVHDYEEVYYNKIKTTREKAEEAYAIW